MECKLHMATADLLERLPNNSGNKGMCSKCMAGCVAHCEMWLGGQPRVESVVDGCKMYYFCLASRSFCGFSSAIG